jgi:hypothetical protein
MKKVILQRERSLARGVMLVAAVALLCVLFSSCEKDGDDNDETEGYLITAVNVENAASGIAIVKALFDDGVALATAKYANNGFTIGLPNPTPGYLEELYDEVDACMLDGFYAYDSRGDMLGELLYVKVSSDDVMTLGLYVYIDSDMEFRESDEDFTIDISGKKGWNLLYIISDDPDLETGTITTARQSGMMWFFSPLSKAASSQQRSVMAKQLRNLNIIK